MTRAVSIPLRPICLIEAVTYLVLVAAVAWHRLGGGPDWVSVLGPVHGVVFLVYLAAVLRARRSLGWDAQATVTALFAAAIPFGAFVVAHRLTADPAGGGSGSGSGPGRDGYRLSDSA